MTSHECFQHCLVTGHLATHQLPLTELRTFPPLFSPHTAPFSCLIRTWLDGVKEDVKCFGLSQEDALVWNIWRWIVNRLIQVQLDGWPLTQSLCTLFCIYQQNFKTCYLRLTPLHYEWHFKCCVFSKSILYHNYNNDFWSYLLTALDILTK